MVTEAAYIIGVSIAVVCVILNILSLILNIISFKGRLLKQITVNANTIIYAINNYCDNIEVSKNISINSDNYKRLDTLSQIADTFKIRTKKVQLLLAMRNEFEYEWKYETDSILFKIDNGEYSNSQYQYLNKISSIDEDLLGIATRTAFE